METKSFDLANYNVKQFKSDGGQYLICEIRKKMILVTEEEIVRQKFLQYLISDLQIPVDYIDVEYPLARLKRGVKGRIDIIVWNNKKEPLLIIECKASSIMLSNQDYKQAVNYAEKTNCELFWLTNGWVIEMYRKNESNVFQQTEMKTFLFEELENELKKLEHLEYKEPIRLSEEEISLKNAKKTAIEYYRRNYLLDSSHKFLDSDEISRFTLRVEDLLFYNFNEKVTFNSKLLKFISDEKCRFFRVSNPSGENISHLQRYFNFQDNYGNYLLIAFYINYSYEQMYINVGIDPMQGNITQFALKKTVKIKNDIAEFWHDGTITVVSSQKKEITLNAVQNACPYLLKEGKVFLGKLDLSKPLSWESPDVIDFFSRMIDYNYIRMNLKLSLKK